MATENELREEIQKKIEQIYKLREKNKQKFVPGKTWLQYAGSVLDDKEINATVTSLLDGWFGLGKKGEELERRLTEFLEVRGSYLTNSGSSANLLVIASLMSHSLKNRLKPGDEIITQACCFPTTVNPMVIYGLVPVFVDINPEYYTVEIEDLQKALSKKTRAVMIAHTLGNPNEMEKIIEFCRKNDLFLIEDNCDSLGSEYDGKKTGSFGTFSTQSFYPPHHMTLGEGGAINYNDAQFERITKSIRDWGRACWCRGDDKRTWGACQSRLNYVIDGKKHDHKYMFSQIGFNVKPTEPQAAMGVEQIKRMPFFIKKRKENFDKLNSYAQKWEEYFILPKSHPKANPCWFSFPLTIRDDSKFTRFALTKYLEEKMIQTRPLFAGNITKQPAYKKVKYRKVGTLNNSTKILHNSFFLGVYPGIGDEEIDFMTESIDKFLKKC